ncbi:MAG TPA: hypothetical protein VFG59_01820 [Anaeromyxobacter sp.]|nr:hypothetical protein [Anaeromyxobacter sp.]
MLRVGLKLLLAAAALAAVWAFVPLGGRTLGDRWHRARTPAEFVEHGWAELAGKPPAAQQQPRPPTRAQARTAPGGHPTESHSDADRKALDRTLSQHL